MHGSSSSSRCFERQLHSPLADRFSLIAFDLPGHGGARDATPPATLGGWTEALATAASTLRCEGAVWVGWSLGALLLLEALPYLPRPAGLVLVSAPAPSLKEWASRCRREPALNTWLEGDVRERALASLTRLLVRPGEPAPAFIEEDFRRTNPAARTALAAAAGSQQASRLETGVPLLVMRGLHDGLACELDLPASEAVADAGHLPQWEVPQRFNAVLEAFAMGAVR